MFYYIKKSTILLVRKYLNDSLKTLRVECRSSSPHVVLSDMFRLLNWTNWALLSNILNVRGIPLLILHTKDWYKVSWLMQYSTRSPLSESICLTAGFISRSKQRQSISNKVSGLTQEPLRIFSYVQTKFTSGHTTRGETLDCFPMGKMRITAQCIL